MSFAGSASAHSTTWVSMTSRSSPRPATSRPQSPSWVARGIAADGVGTESPPASVQGTPSRPFRSKYVSLVTRRYGAGKTGHCTVNRLGFDDVRGRMTESRERSRSTPSPDRHRYAPCRPRSNPPASDLMTVQAFPLGRPHRLSSHSSRRDLPGALHLLRWSRGSAHDRLTHARAARTFAHRRLRGPSRMRRA